MDEPTILQFFDKTGTWERHLHPPGAGWDPRTDRGQGKHVTLKTSP